MEGCRPRWRCAWTPELPVAWSDPRRTTELARSADLRPRSRREDGSAGLCIGAGGRGFPRRVTLPTTPKRKNGVCPRRENEGTPAGRPGFLGSRDRGWIRTRNPRHATTCASAWRRRRGWLWQRRDGWRWSCGSRWMTRKRLGRLGNEEPPALGPGVREGSVATDDHERPGGADWAEPTVAFTTDGLRIERCQQVMTVAAMRVVLPGLEMTSTVAFTVRSASRPIRATASSFELLASSFELRASSFDDVGRGLDRVSPRLGTDRQPRPPIDRARRLRHCRA